MAEPQFTIKRTWEERYYNMDFSTQPECSPTEGDADIASVVVTQIIQTGATALSLGAPTFSGKVAQVLVTGGTHGKRYLLRFRVTLTTGVKLESTLEIKVLDIVAA
jgi:hypothetical protein